MTTVHQAAFDELDNRTAYYLWRLRAAVFVVEQDCPYLDLDGRDLEPGTRHLWVETSGQPVAYLRLLQDPDEMRIGRVVTDPAHRGRGLATGLVEAALTLVGEGPCRLDAQSHLAGWYRSLGFEKCGADFIEDGIPHVPMRRGR